MLRGKRAVITGGGGGFGQALCVWLAREGVEVDFCARRDDDIQKTCSIIAAESGMAKGYICDLTRHESVAQLSSQLLTADRREQTITRLLNENEELRRWYRADLPDAVRRLHTRAACASAGHCLQRLPESEPLPDAGKRPAH